MVDTACVTEDKLDLIIVGSEAGCDVDKAGGEWVEVRIDEGARGGDAVEEFSRGREEGEGVGASGGFESGENVFDDVMEGDYCEWRD